MLPANWRESFSATPLLGLVGSSGSGKTTFLEKLLLRLQSSGLRVAVVKHTHHDVDDEPPGKDSRRLRQAGAHASMLVTPQRAILTWEAPALSLQTVVERLPPSDLILVEGYKGSAVPKILVVRGASTSPLLDGSVPGIIAIASEHPIPGHLWLDLNQPERLADWLTLQLNPTYQPL